VPRSVDWLPLVILFSREKMMIHSFCTQKMHK
jgi:hypothetical protein